MSGLSVTDNTGQRYHLSGLGFVTSRQPGQSAVRWDGELLAEPEPRAADPAMMSSVRWLEFATASGPAARIVMSPPAQVATGTAAPPWPTPAECYMADLASATSSSIVIEGGEVELDIAQITAAVADALLWVGALPPDSALLSGPAAAGNGHRRWQESLVDRWARHAYERARAAEPDRAGLAVGLPLREATSVIESITAQDDLVSVQLYGHPWVNGEYWPMIAPCFQVRAVDDTGVEHEGLLGDGGGWPEGSFEFWFWPPVAPAAKRIRVIVSTLWEAAWAEIDIPGRTA